MTFFIMWHTRDTHLQLYDTFSPDTSLGFLISFLERTFFNGALQLCSHKFNLLLDIRWINFVLQHFLICVLFCLLFLFCKYTLLIETIYAWIVKRKKKFQLWISFLGILVQINFFKTTYYCPFNSYYMKHSTQCFQHQFKKTWNMWLVSWYLDIGQKHCISFLKLL